MFEELKNCTEYKIIKEFYGDKKAKRSRQPLIKHIDEGLKIMSDLNASDTAMKAYMLHPTIQSDDDFLNAISDSNFLSDVSIEVLLLTTEYRKCANAYLCRDHTTDWSLDKIRTETNILCKEVAYMLIADKVQNQKDFIMYHSGTHENSDNLYKYFNNWLVVLSTWITNYDKTTDSSKIHR